MDRMKLGSFISQILREIIEGVSDAQAFAKEKGASINPRRVKWDDTKKGYYIDTNKEHEDKGSLLSSIEFEILLTIGEDDRVQGGLGVFAASLGIGIKGETKEYSETANKIKFQILAKLPEQT